MTCIMCTKQFAESHPGLHPHAPVCWPCAQKGFTDPVAATEIMGAIAVRLAEELDKRIEAIAKLTLTVVCSIEAAGGEIHFSTEQVAQARTHGILSIEKTSEGMIAKLIVPVVQ